LLLLLLLLLLLFHLLLLLLVLLLLVLLFLLLFPLLPLLYLLYLLVGHLLGGLKELNWKCQKTPLKALLAWHRLPVSQMRKSLLRSLSRQMDLTVQDYL
jgi:hypothetical protein